MRRDRRRFATGIAGMLAGLLAGSGALPALAQSEGMTIRQVQNRFHRMSEIHILKCDTDGNELIDRGELACVRSIYSVMYASRNR